MLWRGFIITWKRHFTFFRTSSTRNRHLIVVELFGQSDWPRASHFDCAVGEYGMSIPLYLYHGKSKV